MIDIRPKGLIDVSTMESIVKRKPEEIVLTVEQALDLLDLDPRSQFTKSPASQLKERFGDIKYTITW